MVWWGAGVVVWSEVQTCIWPSWCHCHSLSLASVKSRLVLPFWYRLTRVVPEKRAVKRVCVCVIKEICSWLPPFCIHNLPFTHPRWQPRTIAGWLCKGTFTAQPKDRFTLVNQIKSRSRRRISPTRPGNDISQEFTSLVVTTKLQSLAYNM